ncbi:agglutinin-like [Castanea sativa]|uniref:agglutinin-like n=1 Tax=Castanea sativa TaxID=21020 RepID=UPI003F64E766
MEEFLTVGLWGGEGGDRWSFVENNGGIIGMEIVHGSGIDSISFKCGDEYGVLQHSRKIKLEVSKEFLVCIAGFCGPVKGSDSFKALRCITFYKNKAKYGPYGVEIGHAFRSSVASGKVVGFHGRSGVYLDAIGVHMEYF